MIVKNNCLDLINWTNSLRVIKAMKFTKAKFQENSQTGFKLKKTIYNHTQAAATAGDNLKFLMVFYLLFALQLLLWPGSEGMVQII